MIAIWQPSITLFSSIFVIGGYFLSGVSSMKYVLFFFFVLSIGALAIPFAFWVTDTHNASLIPVLVFNSIAVISGSNFILVDKLEDLKEEVGIYNKKSNTPLMKNKTF